MLFLCAFIGSTVAAAALRNTAGFLLAIAVALGCGGYALYVDAHTDEVSATALVLAGGAFMLGAALPGKAWLWAAIVGLAIPLKTLASAFAGGPAFDWRILITLAFAVAGALAGSVVGKGVRHASRVRT